MRFDSAVMGSSDAAPSIPAAALLERLRGVSHQCTDGQTMHVVGTTVNRRPCGTGRSAEPSVRRIFSFVAECL